MMKLIALVKQQQIDEAQETLEGLRASRKLAEARLEFYSSRSQEFTNAAEIAQLDKLNQANNVEIVAQSLRLGASIAYAFPDIITDFPPKVQWGGTNAGNALNAASTALGIAATQLNFDATMNSLMGGYIRRKEEWNLQADLAQKELDQIDKQILAAEIRLAIAEQDQTNHQKQTEQAEEVERFLKSKFTNSQLYSWMVAQLSALHYQAYRMAFDIAKKAEKAAQFQLGLSRSEFNYIQFGHWDSQKKGLLAGERLHQDLRRMEVAHLDKNKREFELTKHISLLSLNPLELVKLRETGRCFIDLPEEIFDLDYSGHYFRRIKSVSVTLPCVVGPYTTISCTLRLLKNSIRINTNDAENYPRHEDDDRFIENNIPVKAIATSTAQNDSGVFELSFRDERYLPFEGAGAISQWSLELFNDNSPDFGKALRQFDYSTITDAILHIKYTAREDAGALKNGAIAHLRKYFSQDGYNGFPADV
ncbi:phage tail tape measure protein [bacterium]|nr:phage tail tape measure protein [bacterium]